MATDEEETIGRDPTADSFQGRFAVFGFRGDNPALVGHGIRFPKVNERFDSQPSRFYSFRQPCASWRGCISEPRTQRGFASGVSGLGLRAKSNPLTPLAKPRCVRGSEMPLQQVDNPVGQALFAKHNLAFRRS